MGAAHPTAIVGAKADVGDAEVGPYCVIEGEVSAGAGTVFGPGCVVRGPVSIGRDNVFHGHCYIDSSSDKKREGEGGSLTMGDGNVVREFATLHRATAQGAATTIGDGNLLMPYTHVAHDCALGDGIVLANQVQLGGEVTVGDRATLGGGAMIHQQCRIGTLAMVGVTTYVNRDVPPYALHSTSPTRVAVDVNSVGLRRAGMAGDIDQIRDAYNALNREGLSLADAIAKIRQMAKSSPCLAVLADFLEGVDGARGLVRPRRALFAKD